MGLLDNFERGLERAVRSAFSAGGPREVKPVEVANALRLTMDDEALVLAEGRTFVPNVFTIGFSAEDFPRARTWGSALAEELCDEAIRHARDQGYTLQGPVRVSFVPDDSLRPGQIQVDHATERSTGERSTSAPAPAPQRREPPGAPARAPEQPAAVAPSRPAPSPSPRPAPQPPRRPESRPQPQRPAPREQSPLQPVLEIAGRKYALHDDSIVLGRSPEADIVVDDTGVSRRHLELIRRGRTVIAVDLGSTNGFSVNGRPVDGSVALHDGDEITLGRVPVIFHLLPARSGQDQRARTTPGGPQ